MIKIKRTNKDLEKCASYVFSNEYNEFVNAKDKQHLFSKNFLQDMELIFTQKKRKKEQERAYRIVASCVSILLIVIVISCVLFKQHIPTNVAIAAEIDDNFAKISRLNTEQLVSSNPYDYINNKYYDNIVNFGVPAVEILEDKFSNNEIGGLHAYIAAIAIEDITDITLYKCTGKDWETADHFFEQWTSVIESLPNTFNDIMNSNDTLEQKVSNIQKYGVFGQAFLNSISLENGEVLDYYGYSIQISEDLRAKIKEITALSSKEFKQIEAYLEGKIK